MDRHTFIVDTPWAARFMSKVVAEDGERVAGIGPCLIWTGARTGRSKKSNGGYGLINIEGRLVYAHRAVLLLSGRQLPAEGEVACHRCDNPPCVNPAHIFVADHIGNMADMVTKGRQARGNRNSSRLRPENLPRGETHPNAKLRDAEVAEIIRRASEGERLAALAREFGVSQSLVSMIVGGKRRAA